MRAPTPLQLAEHLQATPGSKERFGTSASAVLQTARMVAAADSAWDKGTVSAFQDQEKIHSKVWGKLVSIAGSTNLASVADEHLPASYTALYALVVMAPNELEIAKQEGVIRSNASSRSILDWTKSFRLRGTGIEQEVPLTLVLMESLSTQDYQHLLDQLRNVAGRHHAELLEGKGGVRQSELKADQRRARAQQIEEELRFAMTELIFDAPEELRTRFSIHNSDDLINGSLAQFTGFLQMIEDKVPWAFWRKYGRVYCLKVARDYNLSDSRAERYQLKKRIQSAKEKCADEIAGFCSIADEVLETYIAR